MLYRDASAFVMPLGKYQGKTLDQIGESDEGLRYLDWMIDQPWVREPLKEALTFYLTEPVIARELDRLVNA